jgi:hypothetical protein
MSLLNNTLNRGDDDEEPATEIQCLVCDDFWQRPDGTHDDVMCPGGPTDSVLARAAREARAALVDLAEKMISAGFGTKPFVGRERLVIDLVALLRNETPAESVRTALERL